MTTNDIRSLEQTLSENLPWNRARIKLIARFLIAILCVRTVNLSVLATALCGGAKPESNYKRLQRFVQHFELPYAELSLFIIRMLGLKGHYDLALDRTNWKVGQADMNILMLSVIYQGIGIPVVWMMLPTAGASNTLERITVMEIFLKLNGSQNINCLLCDREFIGKKWFEFLQRHKIRFLVRMHKNKLGRKKRGVQARISRLFNRTARHRQIVIDDPYRIWGLDLYLSGCRLVNGEYLILASADFIAEPLKLYAKRWGIELLFSAYKTRGFNLEDTRLQDPERLSRLLALVSIALAWAMVIGAWQAKLKQLKLKNHGYPAQSLFTLGFGILRRIITNFEYFDRNLWLQALKFLSCS